MLTTQYAKGLPHMRVNAVDPGYTATDFNGHRGVKSVEQGAEIIVRMAQLDASGPTGTYVDDEGHGSLVGRLRRVGVDEEVVAWRRHLHRHPEVSFSEHETAAFVADTLEGFGGDLEIERPTETSVLARLRTGQPGPTVALRADIDALPIHEESGVEFASERPGAMHACGHDGHTAMLLGAARTLTGTELPGGELRFIFQHGEELAARRRARPGRRGRDGGRGLHLRLPPVDAAGVRQGRGGPRAVHGRRRLLPADDHRQGRARRAPAHRDGHDRRRRGARRQPAAHRLAPDRPARSPRSSPSAASTPATRRT